MDLGKIQSRGQVTVPRMIRDAAGVHPGDTVSFVVTAPGVVELRALPRMTLREALERYSVDRPYDDSGERDSWQEEALKDILGE